MTLLDVNSLSLSFTGLRALSNVSFKVRPGEIHGLIGPNGAGKSTLLNCLSRIYTPDSGIVRFNGVDLLRVPIHRTASLGLSRTFQNLELFSGASVRENVLIGAIPRHRGSLIAELLDLPSARARAAEARAEVDTLMQRFGFDAYADQPASSLSFGLQKALELVRALAGKPTLLLLDEPAAGMNPEESRQLGTTIRKLRDEQNVSVLLVEHDMPLVMGVCDAITVLDHGELIFEGAPAEVRRDPRVICAYLGEVDADA